MGATLGTRQDVIEREFLGAAAVLTGMAVATEDFPTATGGTFQCLPGLPLVKRMCSGICSTTLGERTSHCWVLLKSSVSA
jgi:hypothetical protein